MKTLLSSSIGFERVSTKDQSELVIDLTVKRISENESKISVPITFTINGLRSVMNLELDGQTASLVGHRIPIDSELKVGWGQVELPIDSNASDNAYYFTFADPPVRRTVIVSENDCDDKGNRVGSRHDDSKRH